MIDRLNDLVDAAHDLTGRQLAVLIFIRFLFKKIYL